MNRGTLLKTLLLASLVVCALPSPGSAQQVVRRPIVASAPSGGCASAPGGITGLKLWLDASALGLSNGDQITTWADCSGNGIDATGVLVNTVKPTYRSTDGPGSTPAVRLVNNADSHGGYFTLPNSFGSLSAAHAFAVVKMDLASGNDPPAIADFGSDTSGDLYAFSDNRIFSAFGSSARKDCGNAYLGTHSITVWHLMEFRTASGAWSARIDGDQIFSTATNTVAWSTAPFIGHRSAGNANARALVAEIVIYDHVLDSTDYSTFKTYITGKYGITLP